MTSIGLSLMHICGAVVMRAIVHFSILYDPRNSRNSSAFSLLPFYVLTSGVKCTMLVAAVPA